MKSYIKLLSIIAIVSICADASGTGTTVVHRDVESTTIRPVREDFHSSTIGIKRNIENGTRVAREESLNVTKRNVPHVHRQFLSTTAKPNRVKSSIGDTTRSSRDISTTGNVHVREIETTTRVSKDLNVTKREDIFNHTVHVRAVDTTRGHRDLNVTKRAAHKDEKKTTKPNKVKLAIEETTRPSRDISTSHIIHARGVDTTTRSSRDISTTHNVHVRGIETTTRVSRDLNVTKREDIFNHTGIVRAVDTTRGHRDLNVTKRAAHKDEKKTTKPNKVKLAIGETTRPSRDISTSHIIHVRGIETTTRVSRDLNVTKREDIFNHTEIVRAVDTTRGHRDLNVTKRAAHKDEKKTSTKPNKVKLAIEETTRPSRDISTSHIIHARGVDTTRVSRNVNTTKAVHKKEKATTAKSNKVKLSVDNVVTNFTNAKVRSINDSSIIKRDDIFNSTRVAIARGASSTVIKRELFGGDLNVTKRGIETTSTRIKRAVVEPDRSQMIIPDDNMNGGDDDTDENGDE